MYITYNQYNGVAFKSSFYTVCGFNHSVCFNTVRNNLYELSSEFKEKTFERYFMYKKDD